YPGRGRELPGRQRGRGARLDPLPGLDGQLEIEEREAVGGDRHVYRRRTDGVRREARELRVVPDALAAVLPHAHDEVEGPRLRLDDTGLGAAVTADEVAVVTGLGALDLAVAAIRAAATRTR